MNRTTKKLVNELKRHRDVIANERDILRALVDEFNEICNCATEGLDSLNNAIDIFSEQV